MRLQWDKAPSRQNFCRGRCAAGYRSYLLRLVSFLGITRLRGSPSLFSMSEADDRPLSVLPCLFCAIVTCVDSTSIDCRVGSGLLA